MIIKAIDKRGLQSQVNARISAGSMTVMGGSIAAEDICFRSEQIKQI